MLRRMKAWPLLFMLLWGFALPLSARVFPGVGPMALWGALAAHFIISAVLLWVRTDLRWLALACLLAASTALIAARGLVPEEWSITDWLVYAAGFVAAAACVGIQSRVDPVGLSALQSFARTSGLSDVLRFRHIPVRRSR